MSLILPLIWRFSAWTLSHVSRWCYFLSNFFCSYLLYIACHGPCFPLLLCKLYVCMFHRAFCMMDFNMCTPFPSLISFTSYFPSCLAHLLVFWIFNVRTSLAFATLNLSAKDDICSCMEVGYMSHCTVKDLLSMVGPLGLATFREICLLFFPMLPVFCWRHGRGSAVKI